MTILLTGSTGFLGSRIAAELESRRLAWRPLQARLRDVRSADLAAATTVIHCAGLTPHRSSRSEEFFEVNAEGTKRLVGECERAGVRRFVFVSSMGVKFPSAYAQSKLAAEESVKQSRLEWLVLRPAHIYGPHRHFRGTFDKLKRKRIWYVLGSGRSPIHVVYVKDCAAVIAQAAMSVRARETLNVIAPECTELEYIRVLRKVAGSGILIVPTPVFWARFRKGRAVVEDRMAGLRIPGIADWDFSATPLEKAMTEVYESVAAM